MTSRDWTIVLLVILGAVVLLPVLGMSFWGGGMMGGGAGARLRRRVRRRLRAAGPASRRRRRRPRRLRTDAQGTQGNNAGRAAPDPARAAGPRRDHQGAVRGAQGGAEV